MAKILKEGLTFDDVLLIPQKSEVLPKDVDIAILDSVTVSIPALIRGMFNFIFFVK